MIDNNPLKSHCAQYILPVGLVFGRVMIDDILEDRLRHPEVARLREKTSLVADPALDEGWPEMYASMVELRTTDGRELSLRVDHARGTMQNPLTPEEIHTKYISLATTVTSATRAEAIAAMARRIERAPQIAALADALRSLGRAATRATGPPAAKARRPTATGTARR
jgi:2-methylcitrate dehydratase PrpD